MAVDIRDKNKYLIIESIVPLAGSEFAIFLYGSINFFNFGGFTALIISS